MTIIQQSSGLVKTMSLTQTHTHKHTSHVHRERSHLKQKSEHLFYAGRSTEKVEVNYKAV